MERRQDSVFGCLTALGDFILLSVPLPHGLVLAGADVESGTIIVGADAVVSFSQGKSIALEGGARQDALGACDCSNSTESIGPCDKQRF